MANEAVAAGSRRGFWGRAVAFGIGFAVLFNLYLIPGSVQGASPRLTDLVGAVLCCAMLAALFGKGLEVGPVAALAAVTVLPILYGLVAGGGGLVDEPPLAKTFFNSARWALALGYGYALDQCTRDVRTRDALLFGLFVGALGSAVVVFIQAAGLSDLAVSFGLATPDTGASWIGDTLRPSGMQAHANGSTAMVSLVVPIACFLYWTRRAGIWLLCLSGALLAATSSVSLSRGPLLATGIFLGVAGLLRRRSRGTGAIFLLAAVTGCVVVLFLGPPGGWERWQDPADTDGNLDGRLETMATTIDLLMVHPFGVGSVRALSLLSDATGLSASHNAFLGMAIAYGLPAAAMVVAVVVLNLAAGTASDLSLLYFVMTLQLSLLFFFEDLLYLPTTVCLFGWLTAGCGRQIALRLQASNPRPVTGWTP